MYNDFKNTSVLTSLILWTSDILVCKFIKVFFNRTLYFYILLILLCIFWVLSLTCTIMNSVTTWAVVTICTSNIPAVESFGQWFCVCVLFWKPSSNCSYWSHLTVATHFENCFSDLSHFAAYWMSLSPIHLVRSRSQSFWVGQSAGLIHGTVAEIQSPLMPGSSLHTDDTIQLSLTTVFSTKSFWPFL